MTTYAGPDRWSKKTARMQEERDQLRKEVDEGAKAQRVNRVFGRSKRQQEEIKAIDHVLNMKEQRAENLEQQMADEYPKGTRLYDRDSRNKSEYGEPKKYADGGMVCSRDYGKKR